MPKVPGLGDVAKTGGARSWGNVLGNIGANTLAQSAASSMGQNSRLMGNYGNWAPGLGTSRNIMPKSFRG
jgi:hypothetical protein